MVARVSISTRQAMAVSHVVVLANQPSPYPGRMVLLLIRRDVQARVGVMKSSRQLMKLYWDRLAGL